MTGMGVADLTE